MLTAAGISLGQIEFCDGQLYWLEGRPMEGGRVVVVRCGRDGSVGDVTPSGFNARTRVHEYGGGDYFVHKGSIFFSHFNDQRLYRQDGLGTPRPITPEPDILAGLRYADGCSISDGSRAICIRERHEHGREAINEIVSLPSDGSAHPSAIVSGHDFYSSPRISPSGKQIVWTSWNHPQMPWDGTELWIAELASDGSSVFNSRKIAGGPTESIIQPEWSPSGMLHFVSDRTGWWNLYTLQGAEILPLAPMSAEFGWPQWNFRLSRYAFLSEGRIACSYSRNGLDYLGVIEPGEQTPRVLDVPYSTFSALKSDGLNTLFFIGASPTIAAEVVVMDTREKRVRVLKRSLDVDISPGYISSPEPQEFPTANDRTAFALFYAPKNKDHIAPEGERPPLLVLSHGGPTSAATSSLKLAIQYWTSRGFAVVDVNYSGSSGYGRPYRERLNGQWGIADMEDCINAARYLASAGMVDGKRMAIRGGSAGGYTTLCALVFTDVFRAGASYYGVADLTALAKDTHKFESRYLDKLVGPFPEAAEIYRQRSPVHFADRLSCPVILFQGLDDKVVPPSQAESMIAALKAKGLPFAYIAFEGEGHGFRQAANLQRAAEAELYFYSRVFGFEPATQIAPIEIMM
jgi:dipeptidyl aminopeptidase/acylaminoacyl peptidase